MRKRTLTQSQKLRIALMSLYGRSPAMQKKFLGFDNYYQDRVDKFIKFVNSKPKDTNLAD